MRILFAAPNRDLLGVYERLLTLEGHEVKVCFEGAAALQRLGAEPFDLVIADETLPHVSASETVSACRARAVPVIVLTGSADPKLNGASGPDAVLPFPFLPSQLSALVEGFAAKGTK